ncbi:PQQ-binding-like beta-propeller repeat protein [Chelatococcus sambhunathii]|uniref:PQQ-binding-like beta-propeller repeat protein n=1 Tax=Chelatococcus sambhunathii TaxID=363953 RepID=A0ABU1DIZ7_9HYPH|nr:PQQ-binding-like beta-propeller repeat protein [Chelatococcus sambhunathii]MDR4308097.1 PQQ-binding-like beta-propeller repeat protein [Chelatococcus sambhunathii]
MRVRFFLMRPFIQLAAAFALILTAMAPAAAATLAFSKDFIAPGTAFTITGSGFTANAVVEVYFDLKQVAFRVTNASGAFTYNAKVPKTALPGALTVTAMPRSGSTGAVGQKDLTVRTDWGNWRGSPRSRAFNKTENVLSTSTVRELDLEWSSPAVRRSVLSAPVVSGDKFFFVSSDGYLSAYNRTTRAKVFEVNASANTLLPPAVSGNYVVTVGNGLVTARSTANGGLAWRGAAPQGAGAPIIHDNVVYVSGQGTGAAGPGVYAFPLNCGTGGVACRPKWQGPAGTASYYIPEPSVAIGDGKVFASVNGVLYTFPLDCAAATCAAVGSWSGVSVAAPTFANGYVFIGSTTGLQAFRSDCIGCGPAWTASISSGVSRAVSVSKNLLTFVSNDSVLYAVGASCASTSCAPLWSTAVASSALNTTVANDIIYVASASSTQAYPVNGYGGVPPLWSGGAGGTYANAIYAQASVVDGVVYTPGGAGMKIYELEFPPQPLRARVAGAKRVYISQLKPNPALDAEAKAVEATLKKARG